MYKRSQKAQDAQRRSGSEATKPKATGDTHRRHGPAAVHDLGIRARYAGMMERWKGMTAEAADLSRRLKITMPWETFLPLKTRRDEIGVEIHRLQTEMQQLKGSMDAQRAETQSSFERLFMIAAREYLPLHTWDELVEHALRFQADCIKAYEEELDQS